MLPWITLFLDGIYELYKTEDGVVLKSGNTIITGKERTEILKKAGIYDFIKKVEDEIKAAKEQVIEVNVDELT